ncbi:MAG: hypothetical protein N2595_00355 [bacterium]|nr:hypothetical protein [bacterium]
MSKKHCWLVIFALSLYARAKEGDWTNFIYITCYGTSLYWNATDAFDGGTGSNAFNHPQSVLCTVSNAFVIDTGNDRVVKLGYHRTVVLTPEPSNIWHLHYVHEWGSTGSGSNQFRFPTDASFGPAGELLIVDCSNSCIKITDQNGQPLGAFGSFGSGPGQFRYPTGIGTVVFTNLATVVSDGVTNFVTNVIFNALIADFGNNRVVEYTLSSNGWEYLRAVSNIVNYPADGLAKKLNEIWGPYDVIVIGSNVYITEVGRSSSSDYINARRLKGANGCNRFIMLEYSNLWYKDDWNIPQDPSTNDVGGFTGNVYRGIRGLIDFDGFLLFACAHSSQNQYLITDANGFIIGKFGTTVIGGAVSPSPAEGQFAYPYNLARYQNFVFCADSGNNRVQMWKANSLPVFDYPKTNWFEVRELQVLSFTVHAKDDDGDEVTYSGVLTPAGDGKNWGVNSDYLKFSMIPQRGDAGTDFLLRLTASDGFGATSMDVMIHVTPVNPHHPKLVAGALGYYEDWVFDPADDGDLIALKYKGTIHHWDGSVLEISGAPTVALTAKRAKTLNGIGYDTLYGEIDATNEYALHAVAQLDEIRAREPLTSVKVRGSLGRIVLPTNAVLGSVTVYAGCLGGADAHTIKKLSVVRGKIKNPVTKAVRTHGGDLSGHYYPGGYGQVRAFGFDAKGASIGSVSCAGGNLTNVWIRASGHIGKVALKPGTDENKVPIGGSLIRSIVRAGVNPATGGVLPAGDVVSVKAGNSIVKSALVGAADAGTGGFDGTTIDPTEAYFGSVKKLAHGPTGGIFDSLIVSREPLKNLGTLTRDTNTVVIINGIVH